MRSLILSQCRGLVDGIKCRREVTKRERERQDSFCEPMTSTLKALSDCSSHHLQWLGIPVYCGGHTTGSTACYKFGILAIDQTIGIRIENPQ